MEITVIVAIVIAFVVLLFVTIGMPIAFVLGASSLIGIVWFLDSGTLSAIANIAWSTSNEFVLIAIPLFMLMSELLSYTNVGSETFDALQKWFGRVPGGLAIASVVACAIFGATCGTAVGVAAIVGTIAVPEMLRRGYDPRIATGCVAGASGLGMLIPPSLPLILYGVLTETSVGTLFIAGILPGIVLATIFSSFIYISALKRQRKLRVEETPLRFTMREKLESLFKLIPVFALIFLVIGGIYAGIMTPTEAAGVGVVGSLSIGLILRRLTLQNVLAAVGKAVLTTSMILMIMIGAMLLGYVLSSLDAPQLLSNWVVSLRVSKWIVFIVLNVVYLILGMFLDGASIILITVPIVFPIIKACGFDPIWFGVILVTNLCAAVITPPVGMASYVVSGCAPEVPVEEVFKGVVPYVVMSCLGILLFSLFPDLIFCLIR